MIIMESKEAKWLKRKYQEVDFSTSGPSVKFARLADDIKGNFPDQDYSSRTLSTIVREAFPRSESRKQDASRNKYVFGITLRDAGSADNETVQLQRQVNRLQAKLNDRDQHIQLLQQKVASLEQSQSAAISLPILQTQMTSLLDSDFQLYHGPNSIENFDNFSVDSVISELQSNAPDVFELLKTLSGQDLQHGKLHDLRIVTALVTLLKNSSVRILGVQLLLTFTLIARATNKQVYNNNTCT